MKSQHCFGTLIVIGTACTGHQLCHAQPQSEVKIPISYIYGNKLVKSFARVPVISTKGVVQVKVRRTPYDFPRIPSQALSAALRKYDKAKVFRVSWSFSNRFLSFGSTVLYSRSSKNIRYFITGAGGGETFQSRALVSGVTDDMIHKLSTSNKGETRTSGPLGPKDLESAGFTGYLTRYGAKVVSPTSRIQKTRPAPRNLSGVYGSVSLFTGSPPDISGNLESNYTMESAPNYEVLILRARDNSVIKRGRTNAEGNFKITLVPGKYIVKVDGTSKSVLVGRGFYAGLIVFLIPKRRK